MIYQFFLISDGETIGQWKKQGFPEAKKITREESISKNTIKNLAQEKSHSQGTTIFDTVIFDKLTLSLLLENGTTYAIISDKEDSKKIRKKILQEIRERVKTLKDTLERGEGSDKLDMMIEKLVKKHTRKLANIRSNNIGSTLLGAVSGIVFLFGFFWIGYLIPPNPHTDQPFVWSIRLLGDRLSKLSLLESFPMDPTRLAYLLFISVLLIATGIIIGNFAGKGTGGVLGGLISLIVVFLPWIVQYLPLLPLSDEIVAYLTPKVEVLGILDIKTFSNNEIVLFITGGLLGLFTGFFGGIRGRILNHHTLLGDKLPTKKRAKPVEKSITEREAQKTEITEDLEKIEAEEIEAEEIEAEEEMEVSEEELEELKKLFSEDEETP